MFGTAMQYDFLYADTIEENIRFGRELTHEQIEEAAITAQGHDFITAFPDGYEHVLAQKGTNISGGQKQRLLIARAVASKPVNLYNIGKRLRLFADIFLCSNGQLYGKLILR